MADRCMFTSAFRTILPVAAGPAQAPPDAPTKLHAARAIAEQNTQARGAAACRLLVQQLPSSQPGS